MPELNWKGPKPSADPGMLPRPRPRNMPPINRRAAAAMRPGPNRRAICPKLRQADRFPGSRRTHAARPLAPSQSSPAQGNCLADGRDRHAGPGRPWLGKVRPGPGISGWIARFGLSSVHCNAGRRRCVPFWHSRSRQQRSRLFPVVPRFPLHPNPASNRNRAFPRQGPATRQAAAAARVAAAVAAAMAVPATPAAPSRYGYRAAAMGAAAAAAMTVEEAGARVRTH